MISWVVSFTRYKPLNAVTADGPLEFTVSGPPDNYLDLAQTQLYVKAKITLPDGSNIPGRCPVRVPSTCSCIPCSTKSTCI